MRKVLIFAQVEDSTTWEEGFRTHGDLFKSMKIVKQSFATTDENEVAICSETEDLDKYNGSFKLSGNS